MSSEFVSRLKKTFEHESMADVARRLKIPHATVRNYYGGRLPAPEVLMKIARETGVSLNWLLLGVGEMYTTDRPPISLGRFIEDKIDEIIDRKIAKLAGSPVVELENVDTSPGFDVESAVRKYDDPQKVMNEWFLFEGREYPQDYGVVFFNGWESLSPDDKIDAVHDAKRVLDRSLKK